MRFALLAPFLAFTLWAQQTRQITDAEVMRVHRSILLIDTHNDVAMKTVKGFDIGKPAPKGSTDIPRLKAGNVGAQFFAAYVPGRYAKQNKAAEYARTVINSIRNDVIARHPDTFTFARSADEIVSAHRRGKSANEVFAAIIRIVVVAAIISRYNGPVPNIVRPSCEITVSLSDGMA